MRHTEESIILVARAADMSSGMTAATLYRQAAAMETDNGNAVASRGYDNLAKLAEAEARLARPLTTREARRVLEAA